MCASQAQQGPLHCQLQHTRTSQAPRPLTRCSVYELYGDFVMKNPFHEMDQVRAAAKAHVLRRSVLHAGCKRCTVPCAMLGACASPLRAPFWAQALYRGHAQCWVHALRCSVLVVGGKCSIPRCDAAQVIKSELFDSNLIAAVGAINRRWGLT